MPFVSMIRKPADANTLCIGEFPKRVSAFETSND